MVALAASTFAVVAVVTRDEASAEVYLEAATRRGPDPFTDSVTNSTTALTNSYDATGENGSGVVLTVTGDEPGLYGGTRDEQSCDPTKLIEFLEAQPAKAAAWARVLGIEAGAIADYIQNLTPVVLRADTRVTNHGFANGKATARQAVLQGGTAVLVDTNGIPRVRCSCGNPLTEPTPVEANYTGTPWPNFNEQQVIAVTSGQEPGTITLTDLTTGETFDRTAGIGSGSGVFALGTDDGLILMKDGDVVGSALAGQRVWGLALSPAGDRLSVFSERHRTGSDDVAPPVTLSVLESNGTLTTVRADLQSDPNSPEWIDDTHVAYAQISIGSGDPYYPAVIEMTPGAQPQELENLASYYDFAGNSGGRLTIGDAQYDPVGPHWIDFVSRTETPVPELDFSDCGNGGPRSCSWTEWSPDGTKVLSVTAAGVNVAEDPGGTFSLVIPGVSLSATWLDDERIVYSTWNPSSNSSEAFDLVHAFDLKTRGDEQLGAGTEVGPIGKDVLVAVRHSGSTQTLELLNPATGTRRAVTGFDCGDFAYPSNGRVAASSGTDAILFVAGDTGGLPYPFFVNAVDGIITPLQRSEGGQLADVLTAARSPATALTP